MQPTDNTDKKFFIDRRQSGKVDFSEKFAPKLSTVNYPMHFKELAIDIILDKTSIEVFYNNGEYVMTELFFPNAPFEDFSIVSKDEDFSLENFNIHRTNFIGYERISNKCITNICIFLFFYEDLFIYEDLYFFI